jgi:polysaccharide export outer membrane protein
MYFAINCRGIAFPPRNQPLFFGDGDILGMLRAIIIAAAAIWLSGCAASSLSDAKIEGGAASDAVFAKQEATAFVSPANLPPDASASHLPGGKTMQSPSAHTQTIQTVAAIAAASTPGSSAYKIGPQDVLEVTVFKVSELSKTTQVSEVGTINYPLVGDVIAAGKTPREVERELTALLGAKYLQNPQVSVYVKEFNSQRVTIEGAVKRPGVFPIQGNMSLLQAVAIAQGLESNSDDTVLVFRQTSGKRSAARFDIDSIRTGDADDPPLQAGDVVVAGTSAIKEGFGNLLKVLPLASFAAL